MSDTAEIYAILTGQINDEMVKRVVAAFNSTSATPPKAVHLSFHSLGGGVGDAIFLHNFLRTLPYDLYIYNSGNVSSAAVPIFIAGKKRFSSSSALFMIHRVAAFPGQNISTERLTGAAESVAKDNARTEAILKSAIELPAVLWTEYLQRDLHITAAEALSYGLIDDVRDFSPPLGTQVVQI